jgi:hypothetical protein
MKTLLMGIAFAMGMVFASQAFALPCHGTWQNGHYVCASFDEWDEWGSVAGHAMTAADYVIFGVLVAVPVVIVWFALSQHGF